MEEKSTEIEVMGEDNAVLPSCILHDLAIRGSPASEFRPVYGIQPVLTENSRPLRGQVHVNNEFQEASRGNSCSSALHVA